VTRQPFGCLRTPALGCRCECAAELDHLYGDRMQPDVEAWEPWHPLDFAARMEGADFPWFVAGGWAIDLFLGTRTRDHEDLEIAVASSFFETLPPRFPEFDFWVPQGGRT
jgi:hypothetical protein